jgi:hypothetical protein
LCHRLSTLAIDNRDDGDSLEERSGRVTLYPLEGGEPREVPGLEPDMLPLRFSDDGSSLFMSGPRTPAEPWRIFRADLATGRRTLLYELKPQDMAGVWMPEPPEGTPDGRGYAYAYSQILHDLYLAEGLQ